MNGLFVTNYLGLESWVSNGFFVVFRIEWILGVFNYDLAIKDGSNTCN